MTASVTRPPARIAEEITNPLMGMSPDFTEDQRPQVEAAIVLGIEVDRAEQRGETPPPTLNPATLARLRRVAERSGL